MPKYHNSIIKMRYTGTSMNPTLNTSDLLEVLPYTTQLPRPGDVIAFKEGKGDEYIIHRVIKANKRRIQTRGDNNSLLDPFWIQQDQLVGKVIGHWHGQNMKKVWGGRAGMLWSVVCHSLRQIDRRISPWLHRFYLSLSESGLFSRWLPERFHPRLLHFRGEYEWEYKLLIGKHIIGWYDRSFKVWRIRRPFRLFIDERRLAEQVSRLEPG